MIVRFNEEQYKTIWVLSGLKINSSPKYFIFGHSVEKLMMLSIHESSLQIGKIHDWLNESYSYYWWDIGETGILSKEMDSDDHSFTNLKWRLSCITKKLFNNNNNKLVNINRGAKKCLIIVSVCNVRGDTWHRSWSRSWHCSSNQFHRWHRLHCQLKHIILINDSD